MTGLEIGLSSVAVIVVLIYSGLHVGVALSLVSFLSVMLQRGDPEIAVRLLTLAAADSIADQTFAVIPLFVLMGLIMSASDVGRDAYDVGDYFLRRVRGGLGLATISSNAIFAAVTGVSIASAAVFTRIAVPEMLRLGYNPRFAVGTVAGSSVLGMLIPPSILLIIYAILAEQSIGLMFFAGIGPGILLSGVYCVGIIGMAYLTPGFVYDRSGRFSDPEAIAARDPKEVHSQTGIALKLVPLAALVFIVLGGIYGGVFTPTEAGAVGALAALILSILRRRILAAGPLGCGAGDRADHRGDLLPDHLGHDVHAVADAGRRAERDRLLCPDRDRPVPDRHPRLCGRGPAARYDH